MNQEERQLSKPSRQGATDEAPHEPDQEALRDENLDLTIEDSFPASDPPSTIPDPADGEAQARHKPGDEAP